MQQDRNCLHLSVLRIWQLTLLYFFERFYFIFVAVCDCSLTVFGALSSLLRRSSYRVVLNEQLLWRRVIH